MRVTSSGKDSGQVQMRESLKTRTEQFQKSKFEEGIQRGQESVKNLQAKSRVAKLKQDQINFEQQYGVQNISKQRTLESQTNQSRVAVYTKRTETKNEEYTNENRL